MSAWFYSPLSIRLDLGLFGGVDSVLTVRFDLSVGLAIVSDCFIDGVLFDVGIFKFWLPTAVVKWVCNHCRMISGDWRETP